MDAPLTIYGYHGTTEERAEAILSRGFRISGNDWDWLGMGIYFWQDAPYRAWEWAEDQALRRGNRPAVLRAEIRLDGCMDLLDIEWADDLRNFYFGFVHQLGLLGMELPVNRGGAHYLDKIVLDHAVSTLHTEYNVTIRVIRGAFPEGDEVYPGSAINNRNHVQIAVRDASLILDVRQMERE